MITGLTAAGPAAPKSSSESPEACPVWGHSRGIISCKQLGRRCVTGLGLQPLKGAERDGALSFRVFKGIGQGVVGFATKLVIGVFDLSTPKRKSTTQLPRLTRFIAQDGIVRPYSQRETLGQFWLKVMPPRHNP